MFRFRSLRATRIRTFVARFTLTASVAFAVGIGVANGQTLQPQQPGQQPQPAPQQLPQDQPLAQPTQGVVSGSAVTIQSSVAAAPMIVTSTGFADPRTSQILGVHESHCGHVIDLLIRNRMRQQSGAVGAELAPGLLLSRPPSSNQIGDLELVDVHLFTDGGPGCGPVIQVTVRNNSAVPVGNFQISIVGILGQIHAHCPTARGTVTQIPAGAVAPFQLQLPASAMALGFQGQPTAPFDTVVVAIDSFDELMEANELNNVRIIRRVELLPLAPLPVVEVAAPAVVPVVPGTTVPADTAIPSPTQPASPLDGINFDDLQLESTVPTAAGMTEFFRNSGM